MLEKTIESIKQKIRKEIIQPGMDNIPLNYILTRKIPESIKHFFNQEVETWIRDEAEKFSSSDKFDYDNPEIQVLVDKIFDNLKQTATFSVNKFNLLLERAVKLEASYLIRPHQTLTQFLFKDNSTITTIEVYDMLKYFEKFTYYKDAFTEYFNKKYMRVISQNQFEELINGVDEQVFSKNPVEMTLQVTKAILDFLNEGQTDRADKISLELVSTAYGDRKLNDYTTLIEKERKGGTQEISIAELEQMLRAGKTLDELKAAPAEKVEPVPEIADIEEEKPELEVESISVSEQQEEPEVEVEEEVEEEEVEEEYEEEEEEVVATAADALASAMGNKMKADNLADLSVYITPKYRKKFIKKVFNKKEKQYEEIIASLNKTPDWKRASSIIDEFFMNANINPYSREALEFSDFIYNRYFPKDISHKKNVF
jgi:hypothetical protein